MSRDMKQAVYNLIAAFNHPKPPAGWLSTTELCKLMHIKPKNARYMKEQLVKAKLATAKTFLVPSGKVVCRHTYLQPSPKLLAALGKAKRRTG